LIPSPIFSDVGEFPVVKPGPAQRAIVHLKADGFDQMQAATGIDAQAHDIAGIRRNLRLKKDDVKHGFAAI
jgi:hypothetical protein